MNHWKSNQQCSDCYLSSIHIPQLGHCKRVTFNSYKNDDYFFVFKNSDYYNVIQLNVTFESYRTRFDVKSNMHSRCRHYSSNPCVFDLKILPLSQVLVYEAEYSNLYDFSVDVECVPRPSTYMIMFAIPVVLVSIISITVILWSTRTRTNQNAITNNGISTVSSAQLLDNELPPHYDTLFDPTHISPPETPSVYHNTDVPPPYHVNANMAGSSRNTPTSSPSATNQVQPAFSHAVHQIHQQPDHVHPQERLPSPAPSVLIIPPLGAYA